MSGVDKIKKFKAAGFSDEEISTWSAEKRREFSQAGFSEAEIGTWFGKPPFDPKPVVDEFTSNVKKVTHPEGGETKEVTSFMEAIEAGFQTSIAGLEIREATPSKVLAEDAPRSSRIASSMATLAGDFPTMVIGGLLGAGVSTPGGPVAMAAGAGAGAFGLAAGWWRVLMDKYDNGEVDTFSEFWDRTSGAVIETTKGMIVGAATGLAGPAVKAIPLVKTAPSIVQSVAATAAEIPTMVTAGAALEGRIPDKDEFIDGAFVIFGLKGLVAGTKKIGNVYKGTGVRPTELLADMERDPTIKADVLSDNIEIPRAYKKGVEPPSGIEPVVEKKPEVKPAPKTSPEQEKVLEQVVQEAEKKEPTTASDLYTRYIDRKNPIQKAEIEAAGKLKPAEVSPTILDRLNEGIFGKGQEFIRRGPFDFDTFETVGKGYEQILRPVKDDLNGFRAYAVSKRAIEIGKQGKESGIDLKAAQKVVRDGSKKYETVFQERLEFVDARLNYLKQSGVISEKAVKAMREAHKDYVPFYRFFEDQSRGSSSSKVYNPIKKLKGGKQKIIDPLESDIKDTFLFIALAEKNASQKAFVNLGPEFAQKVKTPSRPIEVKPGELGEGVPAEAANVFRSFTKPLAKDEIAVFTDGKREVYKVDPGVAEAFASMDRTSAGFLGNMLNAPAVFLRAGTVLNPDFFFRNVMRDAVSAFVYAGSNPIKTIKGAVSIVKKDTAFQNWMKGGGANATMVSIDRNYIQAELFKLNTKTGIMERAWNVAKKPVEILQITSELLENSTRLGSVRSQLMNAKSKASIQASSYIAREATVDFARRGADPLFYRYTRMAAFMNPAIQGMDRMFRAMKDNPKETVAKSFAAITIPSLTLWWANHDDPRYKEIPRWQKDMFWIVLTDKHIYRVPKPFELGVVFGTGPERMMDQFFTDNPDALKDFDKTMMEAFGINTVPTFAAPMVEQMANRSLFTGNPLIPGRLEKLLPEYQYNEYTKEVTKAMGKLIGAFPGITKRSISDEDTFAGGVARALTTPVLMENYLRSWTGGLGNYILQIADASLRKSGVLPDPVLPAKTLADIPFVKAFVVRYPSATAQSIQDFYDTYYQKKRVFDTIMAKAQEGDVAAVEKSLKFDESAMVDLTGIREVLTQQSQIIRLIHKNPDISPEEKRQLIDTLYFRMIEISQAGNKMFKKIEKTQ